MGGIANLVAKSLVALDKSDASPRWHLLETTRTYALEKLAAHGEAEQAARRHAAYYRTLLERAETEWDARPTAEMRVDHGRQVDNVRAAIDWAFSPGGDASLGVALTTAAVPLWMHLSLLQECRGRVERAIAALAATAHQDTSQEMKLHAALGASLAWVGGSIAESDAAWARALHLAESWATSTINCARSGACGYGKKVGRPCRWHGNSSPWHRPRPTSWWATA